MNTNYSLPDHSRLHAANNPYVEINEPFSSFQNFSPDGRQMSTYQHHGAPTTVHPISRNWVKCLITLLLDQSYMYAKMSLYFVRQILSTSNPQNWQTPAQVLLIACRTKKIANDFVFETGFLLHCLIIIIILNRTVTSVHTHTQLQVPTTQRYVYY